MSSSSARPGSGTDNAAKVDGATRQQQVISLYLKPLHACADEIYNMRVSGKSTFSKEDAVVKRILSQLERIFTADTRQDPGAFFDFLLCAVAFLAENDAGSGSVSRLKGRLATSASEQLSQIKSKMSFAADALRGKLGNDVGGSVTTSRDRSSSSFVSDETASATELDLLLRPIESTQHLDISNRLDSLHYWILRCLRLPGSFQATLRRCVMPMGDVLVGFIGPKSPFFLTAEDSATPTTPTSSTSTQPPVINQPFIDGFIAVLSRLDAHPTLGANTFDVNLNAIDLFQITTSHNDDYRGAGIVDMYNRGKKNVHQVRFKIGIKTKGINKRLVKPRRFHGVGGGSTGAVLIPVVDQNLQTDDELTGFGALQQRGDGGRNPSDTTASPTLWTPSPSRQWTPGDPLTSVNAAQNLLNLSARASPGIERGGFADNSVEEVFEAKGRNGGKGAGGKQGAGTGVMMRNQAVQPDSMFKVLSFAELCAMYRALEDDRKKLNVDWEELRKREQALKETEDRYNRSAQTVAKVVLNLNELYTTHAAKVRDKNLLGQRVFIRDFDKKVEDVLKVFEVGDFDLVEDEGELNAAGMAPPSNRNFISARSPTVFGGDSFTSFAGADAAAVLSSPNHNHPTGGATRRPLVVVDEDETKPPHTQVGTMELKLREPQEVERGTQLKKQNSRCPDCGVFFGEESENRLVDVVKKASQRIMHQKPRRCHYCTQLLCHSCHVNDTSILPFRALLKWDFTYEHVCKKCHRFLESNFDRALFDIRRIAPEIRQRKIVMCCLDIRRHLIRAAFVVRECTHRTSASLAEELNTHYFMREFFYSLKDLFKLAKEETKGSTPIAYVPGVSNVIDLVTSVAGVDNQSLNSFLAQKLLKCREHIAATCPMCKSRASMPCAICRRAEPVFVYDENADQCLDCSSIYHESCLRAEGCPVCAEAPPDIKVTDTAAKKRIK